ncbi:MAG: hypothetical protein ACLFQT_01290 [Thiohalophilus sp.]
MVLILVDGQSDINQLHNKAAGFDGLEQALERLALDGFIEANNKAWQPVEAISEQTDELENDGSFNARAVKARLVDAAILVLGNDAEKITKMLHEAPDTPDGLEAAILRCKKMVDLTIDEGRSAELKQKCLEIIGKI